MTLKGRFFDGRQASAHEAELSLDEQGRLHCDPALVPPQPISEVQISRRVGNVARQITFADGGMFETTEHGTLDGWLREYGIDNGWVHRLESNYRLVAAALAATVVLFAALYLWGIPWLSARIADHLPASISRHIGHGVLQTLDGYVFKPSTLDQERRADLRRRFRTLVAGDPRIRGATLVFREGGPIGANAFALPDGTVVMTDELVSLAQQDGELESVMLHELGHLVHHHSLRRVISHSGLAVLTLAVTGDVNSAGTIIVALPGVLLDSSYSRAMETEADDYAVQRMRQAHIPVTRLADFLQRLEDSAAGKKLADKGKSGAAGGQAAAGEAAECSGDSDSDADSSKPNPRPGWTSYIASHPPTAQRIARIRAAAAGKVISE